MAAELPHERVRVRLAPSPIAGIGVFAIEPIQKGTSLFANDKLAIKWIDEQDVADLEGPKRELYDDFAIRKDGKLGCPENFNLLTVGWYLNEPVDGAKPNARMTRNYEIIAARDIEAGEELTILYSSFSDAE